MSFRKKKNKNEKVYCKYCKYFGEDRWEHKACSDPNNIKYTDSYYKRKEEKKFRPRELNKDNNCLGFKKSTIITKIYKYLDKITFLWYSVY